jgi:hypothetical protein
MRFFDWLSRKEKKQNSQKQQWIAVEIQGCANTYIRNGYIFELSEPRFTASNSSSLWTYHLYQPVETEFVKDGRKYLGAWKIDIGGREEAFIAACNHIDQIILKEANCWFEDIVT